MAYNIGVANFVLTWFPTWQWSDLPVARHYRIKRIVKMRKNKGNSLVISCTSCKCTYISYHQKSPTAHEAHCNNDLCHNKSVLDYYVSLCIHHINLQKKP